MKKVKKDILNDTLRREYEKKMTVAAENLYRSLFNSMPKGMNDEQSKNYRILQKTYQQFVKDSTVLAIYKNQSRYIADSWIDIENINHNEYEYRIWDTTEGGYSTKRGLNRVYKSKDSAIRAIIRYIDRQCR